MAGYRNLSEKEGSNEPAGPTPEELLAEKEAALESEKAARATDKAATDARLEEMDKRIRDSYANRGQPYQQPTEIKEAQHELGITDEELAQDPKRYVEQLSSAIADKKIQAYDKEVSAVVGNQASAVFDLQVDALRSHRYFADLEPLLLEHFQNTPGAKLDSTNVKKVFSELIGNNVDELQKRETSRLEKEAAENAAPDGGDGGQVTPPSRRAVEPSINTPSLRPSAPVKEKAGLDPVRKELMESFNRQSHLNMTEEEWQDIEEGRKLPVKKSAAIQLGRGRPNVEYES